MANDVTIPASAVWYVRSALMLAISITEKQLKDFKQAVEDNQVPEFYKDSIEGAIIHHTQWLREAKEEFEKLPEGLRPLDWG